MKKRHIIWILTLTLLLCGCQKEAGPYTPPEMTYGTIQSAQLHAEDGNYERAKTLWQGAFVEIETGYFTVIDDYLYYADKESLSDWVVVCPEPECDHYGNLNCVARTGCDIVLEHGRFYQIRSISKNRHLYSGSLQNWGDMLCSMAVDTSDARMEHICEEAMLTQGGDRTSTCVLPGGYLASRAAMQADGSFIAQLWNVDNGVETLLYETTFLPEAYTPISVYSARMIFGLRGDRAFATDYLDPDTARFLCWIEDGQMKQAEVSQIPYALCYMEDGILRSFVPNDGYYDYDLETGESIRLGDAQLENSGVFILQPNCIFESNMIYSKDPDIEDKSNQMDEYGMRFFDGQQWHDVALPPEVTELGQSLNLGVRGLQSDCVIFSLTEDPDAPTLYRMALDQKSYKLEKIGQLRIVESAD